MKLLFIIKPIIHISYSRIYQDTSSSDFIDNTVVDQPPSTSSLPELSDNHVVGFVAITIVIICFLVGGSMMYFRNRLETRYGIRHRLVNDDDEENCRSTSDVRDVEVY